MKIFHSPSQGKYYDETGREVVVEKDSGGNLVYLADGRWNPVNMNTQVSTPDDQSMSWADVGAQAFRNIPKSAGRALEGIYDAVTSPRETLRTLANIGQGALQKLVPGEQPQEKYADAVWQYAKDRFGGMANIKRTLADDPVGALSDASTLFTGGAGAVRGLGSLAGKVGAAGRVANALNGMAGAMQTAARYTDPLQAAGRTVGKAVDLGYGRNMTAAQKIYQGALKPSTAKYSNDDVLAMTRAGVENRIPVTNAGVKRTNAIVGDLNAQVDDAIAAADAGGRTIDPEAVAKGALWSDARQSIARQNLPERDLNAFDRGVGEFLDFHGNDNTVAAAQEGKKATYRQYEKKYQKNAPDMNPGKTEAAMELARQQRIAIENAVPEVRDLNRREGTMIDLRDSIERAANRTGNHDVIGLIPTLVGTTVGQAGGLGPGALAAAGTSFLRAPAMRSRAAFLLDDLSKKGTPDLYRRAMAGLYGTGALAGMPGDYSRVYGVEMPEGGIGGILDEFLGGRK